jgi:hypothetical protein
VNRRQNILEGGLVPMPGPVSLKDQFCASNGDPVCWNPWNRVVQDHRTGVVDVDATNYVRRALKLPVPWSPDMQEASLPPVHLPEDSLKPKQHAL